MVFDWLYGVICLDVITAVAISYGKDVAIALVFAATRWWLNYSDY